jgi:hypothetical protein
MASMRRHHVVSDDGLPGHRSGDRTRRCSVVPPFLVPEPACRAVTSNGRAPDFEGHTRHRCSPKSADVFRCFCQVGVGIPSGITASMRVRVCFDRSQYSRDSQELAHRQEQSEEAQDVLIARSAA